MTSMPLKSLVGSLTLANHDGDLPRAKETAFSSRKKYVWVGQQRVDWLQAKACGCGLLRQKTEVGRSLAAFG
jgi:hypothetical protein